jgi:ABC-type transport system substrate-binding protein
VRASDFRRGFQRQLSFGANPAGFYDGILGAQTCRQHGGRCDLSAGIVTNDAAGTVTFHLSQSNPDFLYILTVLIAPPAPPGTPSHVIDKAPFVPGTGQYMISQYRPQRSLTLVRNPYFRQWSYAAQPAGYPNVIRFEQMADPGKQQATVIAGRADLVDIGQNSQLYHPLAVRYPDPRLFRPQTGRRGFLSQHAPAAVHERQGAASSQLRDRPGADHAATPPWPQ